MMYIFSKYKNLSQLKKNVLSGTILSCGHILISLVSYPLYLKYLGAETYGLWATLSFVVVFASLGSLGVDSAIIKYVAEEYGNNNKEGIKKYFSTTIILLLTSGIVIFFTLFLLRNPIIDMLNISVEYAILAKVFLPCMVFLSILIYFVQVINGTLMGLGRVDLANYYFLGSIAISIITAIILFELGYGIWGLLLGQLISYIILGLFAFFTVYIKFKIKLFSIGSLNLEYFKKIVGFGGTITASKLVAMFLLPFNKVIIARYVGLSSVTYFEIANKVVMKVRGLFDMGIRAIMPEISKISSLNENVNNKINNILKKSMKLILYSGVPVFVLLFLFAPTLLSLWLREQYVIYIGSAFRIILAGFFFNLLSVPVYYFFMGIGEVKYCFINHLVQSVLNVVVISIFIVFGITNFYLFLCIYSLSIALSAILLIILFFKYRQKGLRKTHEEFANSILSKTGSFIYKIFPNR